MADFIVFATPVASGFSTAITANTHGAMINDAGHALQVGLGTVESDGLDSYTGTGTLVIGATNASAVDIRATLYTNTIDRSAAGALSIGETTATSVNIGSGSAVTTIKGDLQVDGTTTTINSTTLTVDDNLVVFADGQTAGSKDIGWIGDRGDGETLATSNMGIFFQESTKELIAGYVTTGSKDADTVTLQTPTTGGTTSYLTYRMEDLNVGGGTAEDRNRDATITFHSGDGSAATADKYIRLANNTGTSFRFETNDDFYVGGTLQSTGALTVDSGGLSVVAGGGAIAGGLTLTTSGLTMTGLDIGGTSTEIGDIYTDGAIRYQESSDPTNAANTGWTYTKDVSGATELFYMDESGNVQQLTGLAATPSLDSVYTNGGDNTISMVDAKGAIVLSDSSWDNANAAMRFDDNMLLGFGTGSDVTIGFDGTDLYFQGADDAGASIVVAGSGSTTGNGGVVFIDGGTAANGGTAGRVDITGGSYFASTAGGSAGGVRITGGDFGVATDGTAGSVMIMGGENTGTAAGNGGNVTLRGGDSSNGTDGIIYLGDETTSYIVHGAETGGALHEMFLRPSSSSALYIHEGSGEGEVNYIHCNTNTPQITFGNPTGSPKTLHYLPSNASDAFQMLEGTIPYLSISTASSAEVLTFGNASTNPDFSFLGTGVVSVAGRLDMGLHAANIGFNVVTNAGVPTDVTGSAVGDLVWDSTNKDLYARSAAAEWTKVGGATAAPTLQQVYDAGATIALDATGPIIFSNNSTDEAMLFNDNILLEFGTDSDAHIAYDEATYDALEIFTKDVAALSSNIRISTGDVSESGEKYSGYIEIFTGSCTNGSGGRSTGGISIFSGNNGTQSGSFGDATGDMLFTSGYIDISGSSGSTGSAVVSSGDILHGDGATGDVLITVGTQLDGGNTGTLTIQGGRVTTGTPGNVYVVGGEASGALTNGGNTYIDGGDATGTGTDGILYLGNQHTSQVVYGSPTSATQLMYLPDNNASSLVIKQGTGPGVEYFKVDTTTGSEVISIGNTTSGAIALNSVDGITLDSTTLSIDSVDTTNLTMTASDAGTKTLTISAVNGGAGVADIAMSADGTLNLDGTTAVTIDSASGGVSIDGNATSNFTVDSGNLNLSTTTSGNVNVGSVASVNVNGADDRADMFRLSDSNDDAYLAVTTTTGSEVISIGNTSNNPLTDFLGTGGTRHHGNALFLDDIKALFGTDSDGSVWFDNTSNGTLFVQTKNGTGSSTVEVAAGNGGSGVAGHVALLGGDATTTGTPGNAYLYAGSTTGSENGGDVVIRAGNSTSGTDGIIYIGDGGTTSAIQIGSVPGSVDILSSQAASDAIYLYASNGDGGVTIDAGVATGSNGLHVLCSANYAENLRMPTGVAVDASNGFLSVTSLVGAPTTADPDDGSLAYDASGFGLYLRANNAWVQLATSAGTTLQTAYTAGDGTITMTNAKPFTVNPAAGGDTAGISLNADATSNFTATAAALTIATVTSGALTLTSAAAATWSATAGDLTLSAATNSIIVHSGEATTDAVRIVAENVAGGIDIDAGATSGIIAMNAGGAITLTGAGVNLAGGSTEIDLTTTGALDLNSAAGTWDATGAGITLTAGATSGFSTTAGDLNLLATADLDLDGATVNIDSAGALSIDAAGTTNLTTSSGNVQVAADAGEVFVDGIETNESISRITVGDTSSVFRIGHGASLPSTGADYGWGPGSIFVNTSTKKGYINTGTAAAPEWTVLGQQQA